MSKDKKKKAAEIAKIIMYALFLMLIIYGIWSSGLWGLIIAGDLFN